MFLSRFTEGGCIGFCVGKKTNGRSCVKHYRWKIQGAKGKIFLSPNHFSPSNFSYKVLRRNEIQYNTALL